MPNPGSLLLSAAEHPKPNAPGLWYRARGPAVDHDGPLCRVTLTIQYIEIYINISRTEHVKAFIVYEHINMVFL